jgi:peptidylprolyl isomerase
MLDNMGRKEEYRLNNEAFLTGLRLDGTVKELSGGVLYRVVNEGKGSADVKVNSVVTVHYKGSLINGREFDNSWKRGCPEAFRVNGLIEGFQIALLNMRVGDRWIVYIPYSLGYGKRASGPIPAFSTLVFEIELISIA